MRKRGEKEKTRGFCLVFGIFVLVFFLNMAAPAQEPAPEPTPDPGKECAELKKKIDDYADETGRIKLSLSFTTNSSYWQGASAELNFGIARRRIIANLQPIAYKLGVKRLKDWDLVTLEEKLAYQKKVSQTLEREMGKAITADKTGLEARLAEIEKLLKPINLQYRDLGCADLIRDANAPPVQQPR
jgi:hypothetical protein